MVPDGERIPQLIAVRVPADVDEARVRKRLLEEHQLEIGAGLGPMAGKIWRIGLMGHSSRPENVEHALHALGTVLVDEGLSVNAAEAVEASREVLGSSAASTRIG
jgi:alanine-glyoxylate transaminase/serine-glyoxylate transaminase/serine-pyruvate transaminase